jgi:hypothetical protein
LVRVLADHPDRLGRAFFGANAASLAVIIVDFHRDGLRDDSLGAIHPAKKTGILSCFGWNAFRAVYFRMRGPPVAGLSGVCRAKFSSGECKGVFISFGVSHVIFLLAGSAPSLFADRGFPKPAGLLKNQAQA